MKKVLLMLFMLVMIAGCKQEISEEARCCSKCLEYGEEDKSRDCLEVIQENQGDRHCSLTMVDTPHTLAECEDIVA